MPALLLATGNVKLDEAIQTADPASGVPIVGRIDYLERVLSAVRDYKADTVLLYERIPASRLDGSIQTKLLKTVYDLRVMNVRVIFMASEHPDTRSLLTELAKLGVYDLVVRAEIKVSDIVECINRVGTFRDVVRYVPRPKGDGKDVDAEFVDRPEPVQFAIPDKEVEKEESEDAGRNEGAGFKDRITASTAIAARSIETVTSTTTAVAKTMGTRFSSLMSLMAKNADKQVERVPTYVFVGGEKGVGKTWVISTMLGVLGERKRVLAVDHDGTLSALWRTEELQDVIPVYGLSCIYRGAIQHLSDVQSHFDLVLLEVEDVTNFLEQGFPCIVIVDSDPFRLLNAQAQPWNQREWEEQLGVIVNRTPFLLGSHILASFSKNRCFQVSNQGIPVQLLYKQSEPILTVDHALKHYFHQFVLERK